MLGIFFKKTAWAIDSAKIICCSCSSAEVMTCENEVGNRRVETIRPTKIGTPKRVPNCNGYRRVYSAPLVAMLQYVMVRNIANIGTYLPTYLPVLA